MKVNEFIDYMQKNTNKMTREDQVLSMAKKILEVKGYIGVKAKRELVERITNKCIYYIDGVFKFDDIQKYVCFTMYTLAAYTNLELSDDIEDDFDALSEAKLMPIIVGLIQKEYDDVNVFLQMQCDYILADNSIEAQFGRLLSALSDKMDTLEAGFKRFFDNADVASLMQHKDEIMEYVAKLTK